MNELGKVIEQMPKEARVVYQLTVELDAIGGVTVRTNANQIAQKIFEKILNEEFLSALAMQMNSACESVVKLLQSHHSVSACINVAELKRQARGECHE